MDYKMIEVFVFLVLKWTSPSTCVPAMNVGGGLLFEYFPSSPRSTSDVLRSTLSTDDLANQMKILPENRDIILPLPPNGKISLVYAVVKAGPVSLTWTSCDTELQWELLWRPYSINGLEIVRSGQTFANDTQGKPEISRSNTGNSTRSLRSVGQHHKKRGSAQVIRVYGENFTATPAAEPPLKYIHKGEETILEMTLTHGRGSEPWLYQKELSQPGLYIIKISTSEEGSKVHAMATGRFRSEKQRRRERESLKAKDTTRHSVTLSWASRLDGEKLFCLAVSRNQFHSSLCAARELQRSLQPPPSYSLDKSLILGCTPNTHYNLPVPPNVKYYVTIWQQGALLPLVQATLQPGKRRKAHRLKAGVMVPFTLTAGGQVIVKFKVKKTGKKLHVAAVSCYGEVKVVVLAGKERVAAAKGREALHLAVRHAPKARLTIKVSPYPPLQALYRVRLVATHSARKLPIPRLPKNVQIKVKPLNCSSAMIKWYKSPGGATYCVVLQRHPSGRPPEIRPPLQCGWEEVIRRPDYFYHLVCFKGTKDRIQWKTLIDLDPGESFLIYVLVRHPMTGKALTLSPTMLNLPACYPP